MQVLKPVLLSLASLPILSSAAMAEMQTSGGPGCVPVVNSDGSPTTLCRVEFTPAPGDPGIPDSGRPLPEFVSQTQDQPGWPGDLSDPPPPELRAQAEGNTGAIRGSGRLGRGQGSVSILLDLV